MSFEALPQDAVRVAVLLGGALAAMPLLRRAPASTRRLVLALSLGGALVLPAASALVPRWRMETPRVVVSLRDRVVKEPLGEASLSGASTIGASVANEGAVTRTVAPWRLDPARALWLVWATGALLVLARLTNGLVRARGLVRRSSAAPSWDIASARATRQTGLAVPVRMTDELDAPAVAGVFRPVILVPRGSDTWSDPRRFAVLLHELAHVRQQDCLGHVVGQLVCAAHWFDPFAWLVVSRLRLERELAADDAVVLGGARASSYAEDLLAIAGAVRSPVPPGALGMAEGAALTTRVNAIVAGDRARGPLGRVGKAALLGGFGSALLAIACTTPTTKATHVTKTEAPSSIAPPPPPAVSLAQTTIDPRLQAIANEELDRALREWSAVAGAVVVLDPKNGEILAEAGRANGVAADVAAGSAYVTGSTLKAVTLAAAFEEGVLTPTESIDCERGKYLYGGKTMEDYKAFGVLTVPEMLAVSTNIGFTKIFDRLGGVRLERWLRKLHFAVAPALPDAIAGVLPGPIEDKSFAGAVTAIGERMTASPLQLAAAYATLANDGFYVPPVRTRRTGDVPREAIFKPATARSVVTILEGAVNGERATGTAARVEGTTVAGKTGTAEWDRPNGKKGTYASFVGFVPSTAPRFVILVGIEEPKDGAAGGKVAAPVFARIATKALAGK